FQKPAWLVHPEFRERIDVVAIPITSIDSARLHAINKGDFEPESEAFVGDDCFVIGYPFDNFQPLGLPIWKRASIASEPLLNVDQLPKILVDTATRPGLSGSPVIFQRTGIHKMTDGKMTTDT